MDIANSQPLIASILIKKYWLEKESELPDDVKQYQADCEAGIFYENFMKEIDLPFELRPQFKADFFGKVFFSMVIEKSNVLKSLFIKRYPNCYEAVCDQKGGLYCRDYNEFANKLQKVEATIIFNVVNMELIRQGIKAFNIFDSIYVNNRHDLEVARNLLINTFKNEGINPTIKIEYEEHLAENERVVPLGLQHQDEMESSAGNQAKENEPLNGSQRKPTKSIEQHAFTDDEKNQNIDTQEIKKDEMKKKYTVDELLNSKESIEIPVQTIREPSKLEHLKIESKDDVLRRQAERLVKSIKQADAEEELAEQLANPLSEKQIYDFAVDSLKSQGRELSKKNIDDATKLVRHEIKVMISNEKNKVQPFKFVNPYTRHLKTDRS